MEDSIRRKLLEGLELLVSEAHGTAIEHGWYPDDDEVNIPEKLALIHSEVSEALEDYRDSTDTPEILQDVCVSHSGVPYGFAIELADVIIRVADLCGKLGIDLGAAVACKMDYNKSRPFRHGGKRA